MFMCANTYAACEYIVSKPNILTFKIKVFLEGSMGGSTNPTIPTNVDREPPLAIERVDTSVSENTIASFVHPPADFNQVGGTEKVSMSAYNDENNRIANCLIALSSTQTITLTDLLEDRRYRLEFFSKDAAGNISTTPFVVFATPMDTVPPTLLGNIDISLTLNLNQYDTDFAWQQSNADDLSYYKVEVQKSEELVLSTTTVETNYSAVFPSSGEYISITVYAVDDNGLLSVPLTASTQLLDVVPPLPVRDVVAQAGDRTINISWVIPSDIGLIGGTSTVRVSLLEESSTIQSATFEEPIPTEYQFGALQNNVSYDVVLTTFDEAGNTTSVSVVATPTDTTPPSAPQRVELSLTETEELSSTAVLEINVFADQTAEDITHNHILVMQSTLTLVDALYDPTAEVNIEIQQDGSTVLVIVSHIDDDNNESNVTSVSIQTESLTARLNALVKSAAEAPPLSATVVCDSNYARDNPDWRENKYECMRSQIPGVQQLHSALSVLREHNSPRVNAAGEVSTHTLIIDRFSSGVQPHGDYVSDAFETMSANLRSPCDILSSSLSVGECYELMNSKQVGNLSLDALYFEENQQDTSQISQITGDLFGSVGARIALGTGNKEISDSFSGPNQGRLQSIIDLGQTTLVGGWANGIFVGIMTLPERESLREDAFLVSGVLSRQSDSCEDPTGTARTAKWCVLFPYTYYYFNDRGIRNFIGGTSGSNAMYTGVIDLLLTLWPEINSSEADAVVRSCAVDLTYDGYPIAENFFGAEVVSGFEPYYGSEGVDTTTGLGRADLMCLLDRGSDTGLMEDPRSVIDCSFKDDYPHPENREVSRLRISHCEGDVVSPLPVRDVVAQAGDRTINVSWVNPSDIGSEGGTSMLKVSLSEESTVTQSVSFTETIPTEYQFGALQNNVPYDVVLTTFDEAGNTTSVSVAATPMDTVPPTLLGNIDISLTFNLNQYDTAFTWPQSNTEDLSYYKIEIQKSGELVISATVLETNYSTVFPSNGEYISITVYAVDDDGLSSVPLTASTQLLDVVPPLPVRDVLAQAGDRTINVSWVNPNDIGLIGGTNIIRVFLSEESTVTHSVSFEEPVPTEYQFGALQNNVSYDVVLTTIDEAGNTTKVSTFATPMDTTPPSAPQRVELSLTETEELSSTAVLEINVFADQTAEDITHNHILVMQSTSTLVDAFYNPTAEINIEIQQDGSTVLVVVSHIDDDNNESSVTSVSIQTKSLSARLNSLVKSAVETPPLSAIVVCDRDYARDNPDWRETKYECMRSQIPGVQQLHSALSVLREHNSPRVNAAGEVSTHTLIIDRFSSGVQPHGDYVSDAFETMSANLRSPCDILLPSSVEKCYELMNSKQVGNLSLDALYFEENQQDTSQISQITGDLFTSIGARIALAAGNKGDEDPLSGPNQGRLQSIIDLGQTTIVGGWANGIFVGIMTRPERESLREDVFLISGVLDYKSDSCEDPMGTARTAKWCVLFPYNYQFYTDRNTRDFIGGTSGSVAMYTGVIDLLLTLWPEINSSEADAVVRSCAADITSDGYPILEDFFGDSVSGRETYYGSEGVDATTGLGRADLMCLLDSGSDTGLKEDPRSVIDCSFKDDYPHPENREVSRLRISHCEGDVVSPLPVRDVVAQAGDRTINVSWVNPGDIGSEGGTSMLKVSLSEESTVTQSVSFTEPLPTEYQFGALQNNVSYDVVLTTFDEAGNTTSVSVAATPMDTVPPTLLGNIDISLTLNLNQYDTDFTWPQSNADDLSHYRVEIRKSGELVLSATTFETNYSAVFPSNGEYISITVYAVDDDGLLSEPLTASTQLLDVVPPLPARDIVVQAGDRTINVSWVNPSDIGLIGGTNIIRVFLSEESTVTHSVSFTEPIPTEYQFGALQNNVSYRVVLATFDEAGNTTEVSTFATPMDTIPPSAPSRVELSLSESEELSSTGILVVNVFADQTADDIAHNHILVMQSTSTLVDALYNPTADVNIEIQQDGSTVLVSVSHIDDDNNESSVTSVSIQTENLTARLNALVKSAVEAPPLSATVVCDDNYTRDNPNWRETRYECMRSQIPGVQQLHSALSVLREHNSPRVNVAEETSTHTLIIDRFSRGSTHGNDVSGVFEAVSANLRSTCDILLPSSVEKCYELMNSKQVGNLSREELYFEQNQQDTSQISQITGDLFASVGARIGLGAGNKSAEDPILGPSQNGLQSIINLGQTTLVGGWANSIFFGIMTNPEQESLREDVFLVSGVLARRSDSCEDPTGTARTAKWCVLFPYTYFFFNERGVGENIDGTSFSTAMYTGVIDLLLTLWPEINSSEADAVVRSCAVDLTYEGYPILEDFFGVGTASLFELYYGSEGVDATTGLGRADLMCLLDTGSDTGLKEDPRSVIDCSFKDDYPHPENREVSRLRELSHCDGEG